MKYFKHFSFKTFDVPDFCSENNKCEATDQYKDLTNVVYVQAGSCISIEVTERHEAGFARYFKQLVENNFLKHLDVTSYAKKSLLVHTSLTVKEIACKPDYEAPSYFIHFFSKQVQLAPKCFKLNFQSVSKQAEIKQTFL